MKELTKVEEAGILVGSPSPTCLQIHFRGLCNPSLPPGFARTDPPMNKGLGTMENANVKIRCVLSVCMVQPQSENIQGSFFFMTSPVDP